MVMIKALIGLGNIGKEYEKTYHNVGLFMARLIEEEARVDGTMLARYEPRGYMNESGLPVSVWMKRQNLTPADIVVIHDEGDLPIGEYKISYGGGSAGHNGIKSLLEHLKTEDFLRVRVGIRDPHEEIRKKTMEFVLSRWSSKEEAIFADVAHSAWRELQKKQ